MARVTKEDVQGVLETFLGQGGKVAEFCAFYLQVLGTMTAGMTPEQVHASLFLNPKMTLQAQPAWMADAAMQDNAFRLVYSEEYNDARDRVRAALDGMLVAKIGPLDWSEWEHFEVFPTREMLPRQMDPVTGKEEGSKSARQRHLNARTVPGLDLFLQATAAKDEAAFLALVVDLNNEAMMQLEMLFSCYKDKDLRQIGAVCVLGKEKLRWLRAYRWGVVDPHARHAQLQAQAQRATRAEARKGELGRTLRKFTSKFIELVAKGADDAELRQFLASEAHLSPTDVDRVMEVMS